MDILKQVAQLNFSGPWENISTLWEYVLFQLYKTLPNQFAIPFPFPAGGIHPSPAGGHLTPILTQIPFINQISQMIFKNYPKFGKNEFGTTKVCQTSIT